jgi:PAP2 superfamily
VPVLPSPREPAFQIDFSTPERLPGEDWAGAFLRRMRVALVLKAVGISTFMWLFFIGYFALLRRPELDAATMPLTALDAAVPFTPGSLWLYLSLWVYVGIPAGLAPSLRALLVYGAWSAGLAIVGLACFWRWPTAVPAGLAPADAARHAGFALLQGVDAAGNACPSMHVASAVFAALWVHRVWRGMGAGPGPLVFNAAWALAIVWSTLATKQHVALDAAGGIALALLFGGLSLWVFPRGTPGRAV